MDIQEFFTTVIHGSKFNQNYLPEVTINDFYSKIKGKSTNGKPVTFSEQELEEIKKGFATITSQMRDVVKQISKNQKIKLHFRNEFENKSIRFKDTKEVAEHFGISQRYVYLLIQEGKSFKGYTYQKPNEKT